MTSQPTDDEEDIKAEVDLSKGVRGLHHIPPDAKVFLPASIERSVWQCFNVKAQKQGVDFRDLLTDLLKHDIEINQTLK